MSMPDDKRRKSPVDRFRRILSADQKKADTAEAKNPPITSLPERKSTAHSQADPEGHATQAYQSSAPTQGPQIATNTLSQTPGNNRFLPIFWTVASIISLMFNLILVIIVAVLLRDLGSFNAAGLGQGLLGGLYSNFERMDQAHIKTVLSMQTNLPLNLAIPVQTSTSITLAKAVSIPDAHVKISTASLNIDAPASVTLPAGTALDVVLNFAVPVQTNVPVSLNVPVDIAVQDTDLHPAIAGLQDSIKPLLCLFSLSAVSPGGGAVCK